MIVTGIDQLHSGVEEFLQSGTLEALPKNRRELLLKAAGWGRVGVVSHASSVTRGGTAVVQALVHDLRALSVLKPDQPSRVVAVFGPQHGYWQCEPYNMIETPDGVLPLADGAELPLLSLYGALREPSARQLENIDTLVLDLPDIGCRVYTYMTTLAGCLKSAAREGKRVVVLDRPNPLGLNAAEGNLITPDLYSFVGWFRIPMRHGLSLGELGHLYLAQEEIRAAYDVVPVEGLRRATPVSAFSDLLPRMASPNMPGGRTMAFFPIAVTLEGTNISEGRGTTSPFQAIGAPFLDEQRLCASLNESFERLGLESAMTWRPHRFVPSFDKFQGQECKGVFLDATEGSGFPVFNEAIALLAGLARAAQGALVWRDPGYEYNFESNPLDLILGHSRWRAPLEALRNSSSDAAWRELKQLLVEARTEASEFSRSASRFWLYS